MSGAHGAPAPFLRPTPPAALTEVSMQGEWVVCHGECVYRYCLCGGRFVATRWGAGGSHWSGVWRVHMGRVYFTEWSHQDRHWSVEWSARLCPCGGLKDRVGAGAPHSMKRAGK